MARLYGQNPPEELFYEYFQRVDALLWQQASSVLRVGGDVILDSGFWSRESRDVARDRVLAGGAIPKFYSILCSEDVMRARTIERSENPPSDSLWINEAAFDKLKAGYEPMSTDEDYVGIDGTK